MAHKPNGYSDLSPYLLVADVIDSIDWLERALGAARLRLVPNAEGEIIHGEARIGDSVVMLGRAPGHPGAHVHVYLPDPDTVMAQAIAAGATLVQDMTEAGDGDRRGGVCAPDGTTWWLATQVGDEHAA